MKYFLLLLILLAMAAMIPSCLANGTYTTAEPAFVENSAISQKAKADFAMQQAQQQESDAYAAAVNETAQARASDGGQALAARSTAQALEVARVQLAMTASAENLASTQSAAFAQQTEQAIEAKATIDARAMLLAQQQDQATATNQAMQRENVAAVQAASDGQRQRRFMSWLIPIGGAIALVLVLLLGAMFISRWIDTEAPPTVFLLSSGEKMLADRAEVRQDTARYKLVMKLLRDAIDHEGAQSNRIPPAVELHWPKEAWMIAVAILRPYGVENLPGLDGGTYFVGQYPTLHALYVAVGEKQSAVYPPSAEILTHV